MTKGLKTILSIAFVAYFMTLKRSLFTGVQAARDTINGIREGNIKKSLLSATLTLGSLVFVYDEVIRTVRFAGRLGRAAIKLRNAKYLTVAISAKALAPVLIGLALMYATYRVARTLYSNYKFYKQFGEAIDIDTIVDDVNEQAEQQATEV